MRPKPLNPGTQNFAIHRYMSRGRKITPIQALILCRCMRLASRITELKRAGYRIAREMVSRDGKRFAAYSLKAARR